MARASPDSSQPGAVAAEAARERDAERLRDEALAAPTADSLWERCRGLAGWPSEAALDSIVRAAELLQTHAVRNLEQASAAAARLISVADRTPSRRAQAAARIAAAVADCYATRFDDAMRGLDEAERLARAEGDSQLAARERLARMHAWARLGRFDDAAAAGDAALGLLERCERPDLVARAHANLGVIERMRSRPEAAIARFRDALASWPEDAVGRAQLESNLGEALLDLDRFDEAEAAFRSSLQALERASMAKAASIVEGNLADLLARQGRVAEALRHYERIRRQAVAANAPGDAARLRAEEAEAFATAGLYGEAIAEYRAAIDELERHGLVAEAVRARLGLAHAHLRRGASHDAREALEPLAAEGLAPALRGRRLRALGELAVVDGRPEAAVPLLEAAVGELSDRPVDAAVARAGLADALLRGGAVERAEAVIDDALRDASQALVRPLEAELLRLKASAMIASGRRA